MIPLSKHVLLETGFSGLSNVPVGSVITFAGDVGKPVSEPKDEAVQSPIKDEKHVTDPLEAWGWMVCDGRTLSVSLYPELFAALGYLYGGSNDTFNIPDYRGEFLRGVAVTSEQDPDIEDRTAAANGDPKGVGSTQDWAVQIHEHTYSNATPSTATSPATAAGTSANEILTGGEKTKVGKGPTSSLSPPGDVKVSKYETRPKNIYVNMIIKFTYYGR